MFKIITKFATFLGFLVIIIVVAIIAYRSYSANQAQMHYHHAVEAVVTRDETDRESSILLNPTGGLEIAFIYETYLSPHQEGGEEEDTPSYIPDAFKSSEPSIVRNERDSQGHAVLEFTSDLSRAYVYVAIENVNPEDINLFHIHCGRPGQLGPIIIDFGLIGSFTEYFEDGVMALEITNEDIEATVAHGEGLVGAFTAGCPIIPTIPNDKVKTIAGMEYIARQGDLYFNLHTRAQTYFGDMRGQLHLVTTPVEQ